MDSIIGSRVMKLVDLALGVKGKIIEVEFEDWSGVLRKARIPDDQLWGAVRSILLLEENEMIYPFKPKNMDIVIDAGAAHGLYALKVSGEAKKVIAIEAHPWNCKLLLENVSRNRLQKKILVLHAALCGRNVPVTLFEAKDTVSHNIFGGSGRKILVSPITLREIINRYGDVDLMKMDIEGAEFEVLLTAEDKILKRIDKMVIELHPQIYGRIGITEIINKLRKVGFNNITLAKPAILQPYSYTIRKVSETHLKNLRTLKFLLLFYPIGRLLKIRELPNLIVYARST